MNVSEIKKKSSYARLRVKWKHNLSAFVSELFGSSEYFKDSNK